jgi:hypothetical protein
MDDKFAETKREIAALWEEHLNTSFPADYAGKDVNGIDFTMLDANIAGCVSSFVDAGNLNLYQTAMLGLSYRDTDFILPILNEEGTAYFRRLGRLAELVLKAVAAKNHGEHLKN